MAALNFTIDEALYILRANGLLPEAVRDVRPDNDGLLVTAPGGIEIAVRRESFANGILRLSYSSKSWAFKLADSMGQVDNMLNEVIRDLPFIRREGKSLFIDLNRALLGKVKGIQVKNCELRESSIKIEF